MRHPDETRSQKFARHCRGAIIRFVQEGDGKITFLAIPWVLGMLVLLGLIGNAGQVVIEKEQVQNAADSAAYSTALWQARGMNAITTTNHMLGEISALVVLHEAFGGPDLDENWKNNDGEKVKKQEDNKKLTDAIKQVAPMAYYDELGIAAPFHQIDKRFCEEVKKLFAEDDEYSGATIYDGRLTLKNGVVISLIVKLVIRTVVMVVRYIPFVGPIIDAASVGAHIGLDAIILTLAKEWEVLKGIELAAANSTEFKTQCRSTLLPVISQYGDFVSGQVELKPVQQAMTRSLGELKSAHVVSDLLVFPEVKNLELPVINEPAPSGGANDKPQSEWQGEFDAGGPMIALQKSILFVVDTIERANDLIDLANAATLGLADFPKVPTFRDIVKEKTGLDLLDNSRKTNWANNPSVEKLPELDTGEERITQWVRATYPYVDAFRAPIVRQLQDDDVVSFGVPASKAATFYVHWSNRYTLAESFSNRSGKYDTNGIGVPHMHLMVDSTPQTKGSERWTTVDARAEELFTLVAFSTRTVQAPPMLKQVFRGESTVITTYSQAMFYNANGRALGNGSGMQPNTGWDTLNWLPPVQAPEWGPRNPTFEGGGNIWDIFMGKSKSSSRGSQVRLNWQAKLVPVTSTRFHTGCGRLSNIWCIEKICRATQ